MDRLSELPDSVIHLIFSFMSMKYVVRTTILSRRWKDLWTSVPCLNFEARADDELELNEIRNFVNRTLILWKGTKIQKLKFDIRDATESLSWDIILWVRFALEHKVEELYLDIHSDLDFQMPPLLYSGSSIRKLRLESCCLEVPGKIHWDQLKSLTFDLVHLNQFVVDEVLSGSPKLEILRILNGYDLRIHSASLKELYLLYDYYFYDFDGDQLIEISTPNLEALEISGFLPSKCLIMYVPSLAEANFDFHCNTKIEHSWDKESELLREVFQSIHHVQKLSVGEWCFEVLAMMRKADLPSPLLNLKSLTIDSRLKNGGVAGFLNLLQISPNVSTLAIYNRCGESSQEKHIKWNRLAESVIPDIEEIEFLDSFLMHLRIVKIEWFYYSTTILPLIELVLKHASMLERMVIEFRMPKSAGPECSVPAAQKLLRMPRSSPVARISFCWDNY